MSDALRALNDGEMQFDSVSGIDDDQLAGPEDQQPEGQEPAYEPEAPEEGTESDTQDLVDQPQGPEARQPDRKGKKSTAKDWAEREKRRADKYQNDLKARDQQVAEMQRQFAQQQAEIQKLQRQAKIEGNPVLKNAQRILDEGIYKPEDIDADAARKEAQGDQEGADIARQIARAMRNLGEEAAQSQEAAAARNAETAWRNIPYGTHQFDEAVQKLKPGNKEFDDACGWIEFNLAKQKEASPDPWDQELARQFKDPKSEFGQRLLQFYQSDMGKEIGKNPLGVIAAFQLCKVYMQNDYQAARIRELEEQIETFRGATSPSSGLPVNGNSYRPSLPNPQNDRDGFLSGFERLGLDEMRRVLRSREAA